MLEVLIALAVVAIGMLAVIGTAATSTRRAGELRDETFAHWVAMNELTTLRLAPAWPHLGTLKGYSDMAGQKWDWQAAASRTSDPGLLRVDIAVSSALAPKAVINSLTGFIGRPLPVTPVPSASVPPQANGGGAAP